MRLTYFVFLATVTTLLFVPCPFPFRLPLFAAFSHAATTGDEGNRAPSEEPTEVYRYTDKDGVIHFVDDLEKVPHRYQKGVIIRKDGKDRAADRETTSVVITDNKIQVPVSIKSGGNTVLATLLLDTGATITCITEELAALLNIDLESTRLVSMGLADGRMVDIHVTKVDSLAVGDRMKSPFEIGILPNLGKRRVYDGYLGIDFLSAYHFQIDFQNNRIRWQ